MSQQTLDGPKGIARFPLTSTLTPVYCNLHAPSPDESRFLVLQSRKGVLSYFALQDGVFFNGYFLSLYSEDDSWAVSISS